MRLTETLVEQERKMNPDEELEAPDIDEDFDSGFEEKAPTPAADAKPEKPADATPAPAAPPVVEPEYARITVDELKALQAAAGKTTALEGQVLKVFGTIGSLQEIVTKLKSATPAGASVELPADLFAELEASNPELAPRLKSILEKALKGTRGTGQAQGATTEDFQKLLTAESTRRETEALDETHPTWREIVGVATSLETADPKNEFRKWLLTQPADYQHKVHSTNSSFVLSRAIDKFNAFKAAATPPASVPQKNAARKDRIGDAVKPKGDGGQPAPAKTADDEFSDGFKTG